MMMKWGEGTNRMMFGQGKQRNSQLVIMRRDHLVVSNVLRLTTSSTVRQPHVAMNIGPLFRSYKIEISYAVSHFYSIPHLH